MKKGLALLLAGLGACVPPPYPVEVYGPLHPPLGARELTRLAEAGVSPGLIGELIDERGVLPLDADDLVAIKKAGYDDAMIRKMIDAERPDVPVLRSVDLYHAGAFAPRYTGYTSYSYSSRGFGSSVRYHR